MTEPSSDRPLRKALRWHGYDYQSAATYFVTICTAGRQPVLGSVEDTGRLLPSPTGLTVTEVWLNLANRFPVELLAFVAMPDHVHGLLTILADDAAKEMRPPLGRIVGAFKSLSWYRAREANLIHDPLWQRGYHDRVFRSGDECRQFEWYIMENPARWTVARMLQP